MIVILAEKPSVGRDIAAHLGATARHDGYMEGNGYQVTWAFGHLVSLKEPDDYDPALKKWSLQSLPILPQTFELKLVDNPGVRKQFAVIKKLFKSAKELICATDAGREGELIFRYILSMTECSKKPCKRLWLSSLTEEALQAAFKNLLPIDDYNNLYAAAKCRNEADWIVGLNATRNFTVRYGKGHTLWSVGRVQTPVLSMIVNRDDEIRHFISEPFWELFTKYREVSFKHKGDRFKTKQEAETLLEGIKDSPFHIDKVSAKKENEHPPLLFDLTELQREMNRKLGMTAADTLQVAQTLYEQKLITYPRTDSRYLTQDMKPQIAGILAGLKKTRAQDIEALDLTQLPYSTRIINDKKVTDHHAIIPTGKSAERLPYQSQSVYEAIVTRLIAVFYPICVKEVTTIEGSSNKNAFQVKGVRVLNPGWTVLYRNNLKDREFGKEGPQDFHSERATIALQQGASENGNPEVNPTLQKTDSSGCFGINPKKSEENKDNKNPEEIQELPLFEKGESGPHAPFISEGKTKPPAFYNENALLGSMETAGKMVEDETLKEALKEKGIGTPATRASIIETLIKRKYIERSGKLLKATNLGRYLIALIQDPNLKSPELTGEWESKLKKIEKGEHTPQDFMDKIGQFTKQLIHESSIFELNPNIYGECPKCKSPIIKGNKGFGCSKWKEGCSYVLWKHYKDIVLTDTQIRALLQKKILADPIGDVILTLSSEGKLQEIPVPSQQGNRVSYVKKSK